MRHRDDVFCSKEDITSAWERAIHENTIDCIVCGCNRPKLSVLEEIADPAIVQMVAILEENDFSQ